MIQISFTSLFILQFDIEQDRAAISITSGHLEKASTASRKFLFIKGPVKFRWTLPHAWGGQIQGCRGAYVGILWCC